jgi:hypothetical protein
MVFVTVSIETNALDAYVERLFRQRFTNNPSRLLVAGLRNLITNASAQGARGHQRHARGIIDDLSIDVPVRPEH